MGKIENLRVESLAYGGRGVGRIGGKVCFVTGAVPGDEASVEIQKETSSYCEAVVKDIKKPSPDRIDPVCPYFGACGGCQLQNISYEKELYHKRSQVSELFKRIGGFETGGILEDIVASPSEYGYRASVTLHKGAKGYGYFSRGSRAVVEVDRCPVAVPAIGEDIAAHTKGHSHSDITLKADHNGKVWSSRTSGERFFTDTYRGKTMYFSPKGFSQCNRRVAENISETLEKWMLPESKGSTFFDIYSGAGFFSFTVEGEFGARIGVDDNRVSIDCAKNTVRMLGLRDIKFYRQNAEKDFRALFEREKGALNTVLLDPPRKGVGSGLLEMLSAHPEIHFLYYLSCDPARMSRDSEVITRSGKWQLSRLRPFDMFPRTGCVEVLGEFVRIS